MIVPASSPKATVVRSRQKLRRRRPLSYEQRILLLALLAAVPGTLAALLLLWTGDFSLKVQWTFTLLIVGFWGGVTLALRERLVYPLQTLANLLEALREGDYTLRARRAGMDNAMGEVMREVNLLGATLREQRLGALEANALLRKVMGEIDVAVFTFDNDHRLQLVNRAGERLLAKPSETLLGRTAEELGLADCLSGRAQRTEQMTFAGGVGRWGLRRSSFREHGLPHQLLVLTDLSQALREEERQAWQRLIRVLGHELKNSLTPIKSMASTLKSLVSKRPSPPDLQEDLARGLSVIADRSEAVSRFLGAYSRLARLPPPRFEPLDVTAWVRRVVALETRLPVVVIPGPEVVIEADGDQLDQLLINLVRNAVDAALETGGGVEVGWAVAASRLEVRIRDEGPGLPSTTNLFVPFFTTKPGGSGIGLVLSLQIAEAHGGTLALENRVDNRGCAAHLTLPLSAAG